jgi:hypothetical protein
VVQLSSGGDWAPAALMRKPRRLGGRAAGARTALMLSGVTAAPPGAIGPRPDYVFGSLPELTGFLRGCMG